MEDFVNESTMVRTAGESAACGPDRAQPGKGEAIDAKAPALPYRISARASVSVIRPSSKAPCHALAIIKA